MTQREHEWTARDSDGEEHKWMCHPFPGEEGFALMTELATIVASGAKVLGGMKVGKVADLMDSQIDGEAIARGVDGIVTQLSEKGAVQLARRLLRYTYRDGKRFAYSESNRGEAAFDFNSTFARNYGELRRALVEVARWNFQSFFAGFAPE